MGTLRVCRVIVILLELVCLCHCLPIEDQPSGEQPNCPADTYSTLSNGITECTPCSKCGEALFELHPCNATNDVFCEECNWPHAPDNEDYKAKCLRTTPPGGAKNESYDEVVSEDSMDKPTTVASTTFPKEIQPSTAATKRRKPKKNRPKRPKKPKPTEKSVQTIIPEEDTVPPPAEESKQPMNVKFTSHNGKKVTDDSAPYTQANDEITVQAIGDMSGLPAYVSMVIVGATAGIVCFAVGFFCNRFRPKRKEWPPKNNMAGSPQHQRQSNTYEEMSIFRTNGGPDQGPYATSAEETTPFLTSSQPRTGLFQSPIMINPREAEVDPHLENNPLVISYDPRAPKIISNTGGTIRVEIQGNNSVLQGGPLGDKKFQLHEFHFHWGSTDDKGSEHMIGKHRCAAELHLVHWNTTDFNSFNAAAKVRGGLCVLGVLLKVDPSSEESTEVFNTVCDCLQSIQYKGQSLSMTEPHFNPKHLLPENQLDYWTYHGSLTTPPYHESVTWIVFRECNVLSTGQISQLRALYNHEMGEEHLASQDTHIRNNFREPKPINNRKIRASFDATKPKTPVIATKPLAHIGSHSTRLEEATPLLTAFSTPKAPALPNRHQSPININPREAIPDPYLERNPLSVSYDPASKKIVSNTGGTVRVAIKGNNNVLQGGPVENKQYQLHEFHFHWGSSDDKGSEHTILGHTGSAELHFVHWNTTDFPSFEAAAQSAKGLAVIGVLLQVDSSKEDQQALKCVTDCFPSIHFKGDSLEMTQRNFNPESLFPENHVDYWTYTGSLTTPPYYESVTWIVFRESVFISSHQIAQFRNLMSHEKGARPETLAGREPHIMDNYRNPMPLNERTVRASFSSPMETNRSPRRFAEDPMFQQVDVMPFDYTDDPMLQQVKVMNFEQEATTLLPLTTASNVSSLSQSPIDINPRTAAPDPFLESNPLIFNYDPYAVKTITNTGTTIRVEIEGDTSDLQGGPLRSKRFQLHEFHFHWGSSDDNGSEHSINKTRYSAELHLVHWNVTDFPSFNMAMKSPGGLCVIAVLLKVEDMSHDNPALKAVIDHFPHLRYMGQSMEMTQQYFQPDTLLPDNRQEYWSYPGSLTTPPYYENVTWIVFREYNFISPTQMAHFRSLLNFERGKEYETVGRKSLNIADNCRETMPLNKRTITASFGSFQVVDVPQNNARSKKVMSTFKPPAAQQQVSQEIQMLQDSIMLELPPPPPPPPSAPPAFHQHQSPINVISREVVTDPYLESNPLTVNYETRNTKIITNTGGTVRVEITGNQSVLRGGPLGDKRYQLHEFHFHWGSTDDKGSEHTIDDYRCSAELHFVHWNTTDFPSFQAAAQAPGGLSVIGVLLKVDPTRDDNLALKAVTDCLDGITFMGESTEMMSPFHPRALFPENQLDYWTYAGSLTTPPYYESVTWILFREYNTISTDQIDKFRSLQNYERGAQPTSLNTTQTQIMDNFRQPMPINDRTIRASFIV